MTICSNINHITSGNFTQKYQPVKFPFRTTDLNSQEVMASSSDQELSYRTKGICIGGPHEDRTGRSGESCRITLFVSPKDGNLYWYHASFPDFVFSQARARFSSIKRIQHSTSDAKTGEQLRELQGYGGCITSLAFWPLLSIALV